MPLGIEQNNLAPALIQSSGQALVQGIRQIGQQISGHLTELQTKRDLGAMAQDIQGLNVQSNEFPIQLAQLTARHPLAAQDERAKMILAPLGVAHAQWRAEESDARAFNRAMALQGMRERAATTRATATQDATASRVKIGNKIVDLRDPENPKTVFESDPLNPPMPYASTPGGVMDRRTGLDPQGNPLPNPGVKPMTPAQQATDARLSKKDKKDLLMRQDLSLQREIADSIKRLDGIQKEDLKLSGSEAEPGHPKKDFLVTTAKAIQEQVRQLREQRERIQKTIEGIEGSPDEAAAPVAAAPVGAVGVLPPPGALPAAAPDEMVMVIDPSGRPGRIKSSQLDAALQNGYKRR